MFNKIRLGYPGGFHDPECDIPKGILTKEELAAQKDIRTNRNVMLSRKNESGDHFPIRVKQEAIKLARKNIQDLYKILEWNEARGIRFFRISSEICPHISNWRLLDDVLDFRKLTYDLHLFEEDLIKIGNYARRHGHRLTFHPGPFTILNTPRPFVLISVMRELWWHTMFLDLIDPQKNTLSANAGTLTLHIGGVYDDRTNSLLTFVENFKKLPKEISRRIVIENDETGYCVEDLLYINRLIPNIPICFDYFHYCCWNIYHQKNPQKYRLQQPLKDLLPDILATWGKRRPKFHLSNQYPNKILGTHSFFIEKIPKELANLDIDLMLESKCKELTVLNLAK